MEDVVNDLDDLKPIDLSKNGPKSLQSGVLSKLRLESVSTDFSSLQKQKRSLPLFTSSSRTETEDNSSSSNSKNTLSSADHSFLGKS